MIGSLKGFFGLVFGVAAMFFGLVVALLGAVSDGRYIPELWWVTAIGGLVFLFGLWTINYVAKHIREWK